MPAFNRRPTDATAIHYYAYVFKINLTMYLCTTPSTDTVLFIIQYMGSKQAL